MSNPNTSNTPPLTLSVILATWFGIGFSPIAPGTMGSLVAAICAMPIAVFGGWTALLAAAIAASLLGIPISSNAARIMRKKDPGSIVIDEVAGQWIALLPALPNVGTYLLGFLAFRLFDITKFGPIGWADRNLERGVGIMTDDILAGVFAAVLVYFLQPYIPPIYNFAG